MVELGTKLLLHRQIVVLSKLKRCRNLFQFSTPTKDTKKKKKRIPNYNTIYNTVQPSETVSMANVLLQYST